MFKKYFSMQTDQKTFKAFITQLLVRRYYEQQNHRIVLMYDSSLNGIDGFIEDIMNLSNMHSMTKPDGLKEENKPVIGVFLEDIKTKGLDYAETLEIKNEMPENFKIEYVQKLISECPYFETANSNELDKQSLSIKLVIIPVDYKFEQLDKLKKCQELKDKIVKKIQTEEEKENVINHIMHANPKDSIFKVFCDIVRRFDVIGFNQYDNKIENYGMMYKNFISVDFIVLSFEELEKTVKFDEKFLFDYYENLSVFDV